MYIIKLNKAYNLTIAICLYREPTESSRNFTGKGTATYPNTDTYTGSFDKGVSY